MQKSEGASRHGLVRAAGGEQISRARTGTGRRAHEPLWNLTDARACIYALKRRSP